MNRSAHDVLVPLLNAGVLEPSDIHVARALCRLAEEGSAEVLLAAAMAVRAPRCGHICVEIGRVAERIELARDIDASQDAAELPSWPEARDWLDALGASPLVRDADSSDVTPLVLADGRLYLDRYWQHQCRLAAALTQRAVVRTRPVDAAGVRKTLDTLYPHRADGTGLDRQRLGAVMAVLRGLTVISGGPGTGKTTTVAKVLALLQVAEPALRVALAAPTGKAAARMQEAVREGLGALDGADTVQSDLAQSPAFTLHRLLGTKRRSTTRFWHDRDNPLPYDVVVIDEASMVSCAMMARLVEAVRDDARLILLGDRDQLASVEAGAVLGDICHPASGVLRFSRGFADQVRALSGDDLTAHADLVDREGIWDCMVQLDRYYRFGAESGIGAVARAIGRVTDSASAGEVVALLRPDETGAAAERPFDDVELRPLDANGDLDESCYETIVAGLTPCAKAALRADARTALDALGRVRVLTAHRRGRLGVAELNRRIEQRLATAVDGLDPTDRWYVGRPVLVTQNDHSLKLYNGDIGVVVPHPHEPGRRAVALPGADGQLRLLSPARIPPCETVFAMSIHKSQGSQFEHVIIVLPTRRSPILTRELVYTAITRAQQRAIVIGSADLLSSALLERIQRASGLRQQLWG